MRDRAAVLTRHVTNPVEHARYRAVRESFGRLRPYLTGRILDFGASHGTSMLALLDLGLVDVDGVEPEAARVETARRVLAEAGGDPARLRHVADTRALPFPDGTFGAVIANAVFEHIPPPRAPYLREVWRVLAPGGHLLIQETPNKYLPVDVHTTQLPLVPWLPSRVAHALAVRCGRFRADRTDWASSGWRGLGYWEVLRALEGPRAVIDAEAHHWRHRLLARLRLPPGLLDPYPLLIIRKDPPTSA